MVAPTSLTEKLSKADSVATTDPTGAEKLYQEILSERANNDEGLRHQETALLKLGGLYKSAG